MLEVLPNPASAPNVHKVFFGEDLPAFIPGQIQNITIPTGQIIADCPYQPFEIRELGGQGELQWIPAQAIIGDKLITMFNEKSYRFLNQQNSRSFLRVQQLLPTIQNLWPAIGFVVEPESWKDLSLETNDPHLKCYLTTPSLPFYWEAELAVQEENPDYVFFTANTWSKQGVAESANRHLVIPKDSPVLEDLKLSFVTGKPYPRGIN